MTEVVAAKREEVNWRRVGWFLALTFGLTWLLDLVLWLAVGFGENTGTVLLLQLQMLFPAFSAILLGMFFFKNHPLYQVRTNKERPRWFYYFFLLYTVIYVAVGVVAIVSADTITQTIAAGVAQGLTVLGLLLLVGLRLASGREAFARAGLSGGKVKYWLFFGLGFVLFYGLMTFLNALFRLGEPVDVEAFFAQLQGSGAQAIPTNLLFLITGIQSVLLAPFIALLLGFGEEYGWRGYLQDELVRLGKVKGVFLVGVIWGLWHAPIILMGHNYPGYPVAGVFLMVAYTIGLAYVLGYAVFKSGSVLLAAYLHALNNQVLAFLVLLVYRPADPVFSFGIGIFGIALLAVVALLILRDPLWREDTPEPASTDAGGEGHQAS
jgi:membrane protease YdiL (CAAX protease family)